MTNAGVLSSSKMFATLDPTLRSVALPSKRKVLLSDTVGFIRNLPHALVTSFRATLEEVVARDGPPGWRCRGVRARCVRCGGPARGGHGALLVLHPAPVGVPEKPDLLEPL